MAADGHDISLSPSPLLASSMPSAPSDPAREAVKIKLIELAGGGAGSLVLASPPPALLALLLFSWVIERGRAGPGASSHPADPCRCLYQTTDSLGTPAWETRAEHASSR